MTKRVNIEHDRWWAVRAASARAQHYLRREEVVAIGTSMPKVDLASATDETTIRECFAGERDIAGFLASNGFQDVSDFVLGMHEGDIVVTFADDTMEVLIRTVEGGYEFQPEDVHGLHAHRRVRAGQRREVSADVKAALASGGREVARLTADVVDRLREVVRPSRHGEGV